MVSPFDLPQTLPVGGHLLVPCSLPGPPVIKQFMQMVTLVSGKGRSFQSVSFPKQLSLRDFLGTGTEVSVFCNFFLLFMHVVLPSRVKVSLYLI